MNVFGRRGRRFPYDAADLWAAWQAGFEDSGEGWNWEYPFCHPGKPQPELMEKLRAAFDKWFREFHGSS